MSDSVPKQLLNFSKQVALGLHYLSLRGFIHRDMAARNVLVSNMLCKVCLLFIGCKQFTIIVTM